MISLKNLTKMILPPNFDYHLSPAEQKQVERCVPMHQAKIHLAFRALFNIDGKIIENGAVALSEHMITLCSPGFLRLTFKLYETFHLFTIKSISTIDDNTAKIQFKDSEVIVMSTVCMKFIRNTLRNFILSNPALPSQKRFNFQCHDAKFFPPFVPELSPSQVFQFTYNAYCSYYDTTYFHDIPQYYHKLISTGGCVFDLTKLPLKILECGLGDAADIKPITSSLMYCPFIYGFSCANFVRPDIIQAIAPLVLVNESLRVVRVVDAGAEKGAVDLANAMVHAENQGVIYWDLSRNKLGDMQAFTQALGSYDAEVKGVILDDCEMTDITVANLFQSLDENESMHGIEELSLVGSRVNLSNCEILCKLIEDISDDEQAPLKILGLSQVEDPASFIAVLIETNIQLVSFKLTDTIFDEAAATTLCQYIEKAERLETLALEGCTISADLIVKLITAIGKNVQITKINLTLNKLNINGKTFDLVFQAILSNLTMKICSLALDSNSLTVSNLNDLCNKLPELTQLKRISLSKNFHYQMKGIGSALCGFAKSPFLEAIIIKGDDSLKLKNEIIPLICTMHTMKLKSIDVSFNGIGDIGLETLSNLVISSTSLEYVAADGSLPTTFDIIDKFLYILETDAELVGAPLPVEDIYVKVAGKEESVQNKFIETITRHQMKMEQTMMKNRARLGMHGELSLLNDPVLDNILDEATLELAEILDNCNLTQHLAITEIVGLPLPFEQETSTQPKNQSTSENTEADPSSNDYVSKVMMSKISESSTNLASQLRTLQFNSLLIKRPNAAERLANKAHLFIDPPESDDDYSYDEEEEVKQEVVTKKKKLEPSNMKMISPTEFDIESAPDNNNDI